MNFQDAEKTYKDLKSQHDSGKLNDAAFEAEVGKLRMQDDQGRWWQIGVQTGEWYMHDGQKWNKAKPPTATPSTPAPTPAPVPVAPVVTQPVEPAPKPAAAAAKPADDKKKQANKKPDDKQPRASTMPRLFSPKPAGREGGLSRPILIGIIAAVAVVIILLAVGGYFVYNTVFVAQAKPTMTPTRAALPTQVVPTRAATIAPTSTPLPPPTPVVTVTVALTTTTPITPTKVPATAGPSPTKKAVASPTVAAPKGSPTPNVPPGLYVTKIETIPAKPAIGNVIGFKVTFLNTTGSMQTRTIQVLVYKEDQTTSDPPFKNSYAQTLRADFNIPTGTSEFSTSQNVNLGTGLSCNMFAVPNYIDSKSQQVMKFETTKGGGLYQGFSICQ